MAEEFVFADTPEYVWADLPGNEWADSLGGDVVRLCRPICKSISTRYRCKSIRGGQIMSSAEVIRIGHGGTILLQLQAESMDTGAVIPVPESQMAAISRVVLQLASGKSIDSDVAGLGAAQVFDHTIDQTAGKLALTLGPTAQIVGFEGNYARGQHLDIYFGTAYPIEFPCPPIKILPAD